MAKHYPLILDGTTLKELPTGDGLSLLDNEKLTFGADSDLQIYHNGTDTFILDNGTGNLNLASDGTGVHIINSTDTETMATFNKNGACTLYYDNSLKIATTTSGVSVTGRATGTQTTDNDG